MFNGIIYKQGIVSNIKRSNKSIIIEIISSIKFIKSEIGSSVSCNGVCLTLTKKIKNRLFFYLSNETLMRSNYKNVKIGHKINIEKSVKYGQELSGHYVQGHTDTTGIVKKITKLDKSWILRISIAKKFRKLLIDKASISVNGVSLTISKVTTDSFEISIIPHTLKLTNLINLKIKDQVNIELDIFSKYLHKLKK